MVKKVYNLTKSEIFAELIRKNLIIFFISLINENYLDYKINLQILNCILYLFENDHMNSEKKILSHVIDIEFIEYIEKNKDSSILSLSEICENISTYLYSYVDM